MTIPNSCTQGTAGVAIAGLLGAVRAQGRPMIDFPKQKIVVAGAGRYIVVLFRVWKSNSMACSIFCELYDCYYHADL